MRSFALGLSLVCAIAHAQWQQMADFPGTPRDDAAAFAIDDKVFVGTGMEVGWNLTDDWYVFDGSLGQWSPLVPLPATPRQYCSAFVDEGGSHGYLFGGLDANGPLNELWRYDPAAGNWQQMASLPGEPRYATVAFDGGYIATGLFEDGTATKELWKYDRLTDSWQQLAALPGTARHRACGSNWGGPMVVGGADEAFNALADCWSYNMTMDTWTACAALPEGRYGAMCGFADYGLVLIGGATDASTIVESTVAYNATEWLPVGDPHPGGPRRGGIMINAASGILGGTAQFTFIGLGLSDELVRRNDWYATASYFSIPERSLGRLHIRPNPVTDQVWPELLENWSYAQCIIRDGSGRIVVETHVMRGGSIDVYSLSAGRYELMLEFDDERLRAPFIKLP
jgi:hypothetical protein